MKILIADDDPIPRRMLESILKKWDYEVVVAQDGTAAWEIMQSQDAPPLAILDWLMPGLDGVEVCRKIRQRKDAPYTYLILLTSKDSKEDIVAGMEAGADDYLIKPFESHRLQVRLRAGRRILDLQTALLASVEELAQAHHREGEIGARIQQTLLLGKPPRNAHGLTVAALTIPSQYIDGDFYDFFPHKDGSLDIIVGDVMGKGVPAALFGAAIKSHFIRAIGHLSVTEGNKLPEPEEIVATVHTEVTGQFIGLDSFMTLCYARFDPDKRCISFVDCGHTKTIHVVGSTGEIRTLEGNGMPLGVSEREVYTQVCAPFATGDHFCFYSDGITEARNQAGELFGFDRLIEAIRANRNLSPDELVTKIREVVVAFSNSETFPDDLTCVIVRIEPVSQADVPAKDTSDNSDCSEAPGSDGADNSRQEKPLAHASLEITSSLTELGTIRRFLGDFCRSSPPEPLEEERLEQLELAVNEAASNVMRHAYQGQSDKSILVETDSFTNRIEVRLYNTGIAFDHDAAKPPSFDGSREGGFGVYMIATAVDEVQYSRDPQERNCIRLTKYRTGAQEEA